MKFLFQSNFLVRFCWLLACGCLVAFSGCDSKPETAQGMKSVESSDEAPNTVSDLKNETVALKTTGELAEPIRLEADGKPIDIGSLSSIAHAGPAIADVDGDGDEDLLVGDFPGYFWLFENETDNENPQYTSKGKLQAGGVDAKTPVY